MAKKKEETKVDFNTLSDKEKQKIIDKAWGVLDESNAEASMLSDALSNINTFDDTGCCMLNALLSGKIVGGGFPEGRMTVLAAPSSVGKSYIGLQAAALAQKKGKRILIFDSENAIDREFATNLGLDVTKVKYFPVKSIEQCKNSMYAFLDFVDKQGMKGQFFILVDSLGGMMSEMDFKRLEDESTSADMGTLAKSMKGFIKMMTIMSARTKTTIVCTNHIFDNPGQMFPSLEKNMSGGKSVKYFSSTVLQLSAVQVKEGDADRKTGDEAAIGSKGMTGIAIRGLSIKNRVVKPYMEGSMYISWQKGLRKYYGLLELAQEFDLIYNKAGKLYIRATEEGAEDKYIGTKQEIQTSKKFWDEYIPELQKKIDEHWTYNGSNVDFEEDDCDEIIDEDKDEEIELMKLGFMPAGLKI
jgi:recombination protein RecA